MSRLVTSVLAALALLALVVGGYVAVARVTADDDTEPTTARGLAAAVMTHLDGREVTGVSGTAKDGYLTVVVATTDPTVESVHVSVTPDLAAAGPAVCGVAHGYADVSCTNDPLREIGRRDGTDSRQALYIGTFADEARGYVSVQVFGTPDDDARADDRVALVEHLLDDPLLGRATSADLNDQGERIADFELLRVVVRTELVPAPARSR